MRPSVISSRYLAAMALCAAAVAGLSFVHSRPGTESDAVGPGTLAAPTTPGFFGGTVPQGLLASSSGAGASVPGSRIGTIPAPPPSLAPPQQFGADGYYEQHHEYYFTRAIYSSGGGSLRSFGRRGGGSWSTDYPKADEQFMVMVDHLFGGILDLYPRSNAVGLAEPQIRQYPFLYALEVGRMGMSDAEVTGLRDYLNAGGFLVIDDFWGSWEWANFEREISRVLPGRPIVELGMDHPIFHTFYDIEEVLQVPQVDRGIRGGATHEQDGYTPYVLGIFDDHDRLMVVINWNTDLGDAWEWAENPYYPLKFSRFAAEMGINMIVYAMSR